MRLPRKGMTVEEAGEDVELCLDAPGGKGKGGGKGGGGGGGDGGHIKQHLSIGSPFREIEAQ
jgi:hypothetical protein